MRSAAPSRSCGDEPEPVIDLPAAVGDPAPLHELPSPSPMLGNSATRPTAPSCRDGQPAVKGKPCECHIVAGGAARQQLLLLAWRS